MEQGNKQLFGNTAIPTSIIENPFSMDCITRIDLTARKRLFNPGFVFYGSVDFEKGDTQATQKFEGSDLLDVFTQIAEFCKTL